MPLTPQQEQELAELEELEKLDQEFKQKPQGIDADLANYAKLGHPQDYKPSPQELQNYKMALETGNSAFGNAAGESFTKGVLSPLGKFLRKGGDALMQKAVGLKYQPGMGEALAKEGLIGTKGMMQRQAQTGMQTAGNQIGELSSKIPGTIPQDTVANKIAEIAQSKMTPSGFVRPEEQLLVNKALSRAEDFAKTEPLSGAEMAARRAQAGKAARDAGAYKTQPSQQLKAKMASAEQAGYSEALKNAYAKSFPEAPNALANADASYSTLSKAATALDKQGPAFNVFDTLRASSYVPTSLVESGLGRSAIGTGKTLERVPGYVAPLTLKELLGGRSDK